MAYGEGYVRRTAGIFVWCVDIHDREPKYLYMCFARSA